MADGDDQQSLSQSIKGRLQQGVQNSVFRDKGLLDPDAVIDEDRIGGRDQQLDDIITYLRPALQGNRPPNLLLYGPSGTGKSLIINAVCQNIDQLCESRDIRFGVVEMNCQNVGTLGSAVYELARRVADDAETEVQVPEHGIPTKKKWRELYRLINEHYDTIVFVLDELDMLVGRRDKDEPAFSRLLYQLSRAGSTNEVTANVSV